MTTLENAIETAKNKLRDMEQDPACFWDDLCHEYYDQMLDECTICETCGNGGAEDLKRRDPIAYRCGFSDYMQGETAEEFAKQQDEYQAIQEALEEAESALYNLTEAINV